MVDQADSHWLATPDFLAMNDTTNLPNSYDHEKLQF